MASNPSLYNQSGAPPRSTMPRQEAAIPKGFIKQSRVQMLDFDNATRLQEDNTKAIDTAKQGKLTPNQDIRTSVD
jgi:hypothetical protein